MTTVAHNYATACAQAMRGTLLPAGQRSLPDHDCQDQQADEGSPALGHGMKERRAFKQYTLPSGALQTNSVLKKAHFMEKISKCM